MFTFFCIYVYMYICKYGNMHRYIEVYVCIYIYIYICIYIYIYMSRTEGILDSEIAVRPGGRHNLGDHDGSWVALGDPSNGETASLKWL